MKAYGLVGISLSLAVACGGSRTLDDAGLPDVGAPDAGPADAGPAAEDAGPAAADAGRDAARELDDAGGPDAGGDDAGGPDAGGPDAGRPDAGRADSGRLDAGPGDAGPATCLGIGASCSPDRGCLVGECIGEFRGAIGDPGDEITMHPRGVRTIPTTAWRDGYCTPGLPSAATPEPCDDGDPADPTCGPCGTCVFAGTSAAGDRLTLCLATCEPSLDDNGACRDFYECNLTGAFCAPGCETDDECRIVRADTDDDGTIDEGPTAGGADRLVYLTASEATCDLDSYRCFEPGTEGAEAGDTCTFDHECEERGDCLGEAATDGDWAGGYCTKLGCDVEGNDCAGDGVCQERRVGVFACLAACTVALGYVEDDTTTTADWIRDRGGCRPGYACHWNGVGGAGVEGNGGCLPGVFNGITTPNFGSPCDADGDCMSPFGLSFCSALSDDGYCLMLDCGAAGMPDDVCGTDPTSMLANQCVDLDGAAGDLTGCVQSCRDADDCATGLACVDFDGSAATARVCWPVCVEDGDCRAGRTCEIPLGETTGECV